MFGAQEMPTSEYPLHTIRNVIDSDATLWFGSTDTPGAKTTMGACWDPLGLYSGRAPVKDGLHRTLTLRST